MARKRTTRGGGDDDAGGTVVLPPSDEAGPEGGPETTGRFIIIFKEEALAEERTIANTLNQVAGLRSVVSSADFDSGAVSAEALSGSEPVRFSQLGIVIVSGPDEVSALAASLSDGDSPILAIEPEYVARLSDPSRDYMRGYRDAVNHLYDRLGETGTEAEGGEAGLLAEFFDTRQFTWGLQATGASTSRFTGLGVKVAVLDTGLDLGHPDYAGRAITHQSFSGFPMRDVNGHGTHCAGTACGPLRPATGVRRYGVAHAAQLFVGKVFDEKPRPSAPTGNVIAGIEWAMSKGCRVVSVSLGIPINQKVEQYEQPIRRALNAGTLVVAAAGNNAVRPGNPGFVEPPANTDAAMAVASVDHRMRIAGSSGRSSQVTGDGGKVNIAGPGVSVFSSVPVALGRHEFKFGTSMATPHVAGIAALWSQATGETGNALWNRLVQTALPLSLPSVDVGAGLVQAPR